MQSNIQDIISSILSEEVEKDKRPNQTLIFTLGNDARSIIENELTTTSSTSSIRAILRSRNNVNILFLNKLQYFYMYLIKCEAERMIYNRFIIYGLDSLICELNDTNSVLYDTAEDTANSHINVQQLRIVNLIYSTVFRIKRKYELKNITFVYGNYSALLTRDLQRLERYWRDIIS
ncbi:Shu1p NDAI_0A03850 [Naumovozyma dairenensis CBS 421]|uniref:Uncharacterized protein n=1 Tax=Naumovozyma dairenensis (strain ATCC 10597 / BCRC 20456 / CBS 421 / NBRC 0211 / NRRL Y-12639) TaxID=1071378 RepID=G0W404_NAUDC|nr:hypothetical protein NDAI_0A03850 [Naumovozyma dairenensis CBS 421]CCD22542.1 hypothetical protein NDAI_0A03850 [Naumovozyma dairenensis CBS 421]